MVLRHAMLAASHSDALRTAATATPVSRAVVRRFVAGDAEQDAITAAAGLASVGLHCSIDFLGEATTSAEDASATVSAYISLLEALEAADLTDRAELSLKLSAIGQALPDDGNEIALANARLIAAKAAEFGTSITIDAEEYEVLDQTLATVRELRKDFPATGAVLQAYLRRTEQDCRDLSYEGSRVRLCKGAYVAPHTVAFQTHQDVDLSYVRCLRILMSGKGTPLIATHDPRLIEIAGAIAVRTGRDRGSYEFQMLYGVRPEEQRRLAAMGERVRVYMPYGSRWYPYMMRRMAEHPANLQLFVRAMTSRS